jgi:hypothetical protein
MASEITSDCMSPELACAGIGRNCRQEARFAAVFEADGRSS